MDHRTTIERNPPLGGNCGWGERNDTAHQRLYKEKVATEKNADQGLYTPPKLLMQAKGDPSPMEVYIKNQVKEKYDDGMDLDIVDKAFYGQPCVVSQASVGSCVGAGGASAVGTKAAVEVLIEGDPENPCGMTVVQFASNSDSAAPNVDYTYGCGKMKSYWNGTKFNGSRNLGDGSYCAAHIWALMTCGILPCSEVKDSGAVFPQTNNIRRNAGNNGDFLNRHLDVGLKHRMQNTTRVESFDDLKNVVVELLQPCMICSNIGFAAGNQVSGLGWVYKPSGSWAHNMSLVAVVNYKGVWYVKVRNQWGPNAHKDGWYFWITADTFSWWVQRAEVQSIGELNLLPSESIPAFPGPF